MNIKVVIDRRKFNPSIKTYEARGICHVYEGEKELIHEYFISGPWGKGHLPIGKYVCRYATLSLEDAFKLCDFGWIASMEPQFKTDRTQICLHPDGGKYIGTLGCVGLQFKTNLFNKKFYDIIQQGLKKGSITIDVIDASKKV